MQLEDLLQKTCVIGVSYFDTQGELMKQNQCAGQVVKVDAENGISIALRHSDPAVAAADFIVPPNLEAWFKAPAGRYRHAPSGMDMENPDYLVTWNVFRTQDHTLDGQHTWWEWVPNTERPQVGASADNPHP
ncbi:MAG: hypothetical protein A3F78_14020 [Burkholderiales bacterium RIFCSPLOWO2_12_FULL_61_40]|nr:MAG: hypothetical protein A3F78_14020 [Burkholderiales bacterium RIFCSPLOWO2_12_FULL_61_40]